MQMALPAPIYPPIDSILHRLELICRPVWFFFWLPHSLWTPQSALNRGGRKKKKHVTAQRWWLKDRYHFYNSKFPWQHYSGLMPPEGLQQFLCSEQMAAFFLLFFRHVALDLFWTFLMYNRTKHVSSWVKFKTSIGGIKKWGEKKSIFSDSLGSYYRGSV